MKPNDPIGCTRCSFTESYPSLHEANPSSPNSCNGEFSLKCLEQNTLLLSGEAFAEIARAILEKGSLFRLCARGNSMTPFIRSGDRLTISPLAGQAPRVGEVVAFSMPGEYGSELVIHRVVERRRTSFVIQGDANGSLPALVPSEYILGRTVKAERNGSRIRLGLGPEGRLIAWLSRTRLLWRSIWAFWGRVRPFLKCV
ncbi:MAG: S26 family signal peptidase [Thermodesulfobacteriota bacterium]